MKGTEKPTRKRIVSRRSLLASTGTAMALGVAGCTGGDDSGDDGDSETTADSEPEKPEKLLVRAWGGSWQGSLEEEIATPFTEDTGIAVEFDNTSEEVMQGKIRTAIDQDRTPPVNVNWSTTPMSYRAYKQGLMENLDLDVVPNLEELLGAAKPNVDTEWPFVNLYSYVYTLSYNTDEVSSPPTSWEQWWSEDWQNDLGLYTNGTGFTPVVASMVGEELDGDMSETWDRYRELKPNVGLIGDDTQLTQNLRNGEVAMATLIVSNTYNAKNEGAPVDYTVPEEGAVAKRDAMYIPKGQEEKYTYWGQKFINYATQANYLGSWAGSLGVAPLNPNSDVPEFMEEAEAYPTSAEQFESMITVDPATYVEHSNYWFSQVNNILKG